MREFDRLAWVSFSRCAALRGVISSSPGVAAMKAEDLEALMKNVMPDEVLESLAREVRLQERARKLDPLALVRAAILAEAAVMRQ